MCKQLQGYQDTDRVTMFMSIAHQIILKYFNHLRSLMLDNIHLIFLTKYKMREKLNISLYADQ